MARRTMPARTGAAIQSGKTTAYTDMDRGRFVKLVPNEQVVEVMEFETTDPSIRGELPVTFTLIEADGGTDVFAVHDNLPPGISLADKRKGQRSITLRDFLTSCMDFGSVMAMPDLE